MRLRFVFILILFLSLLVPLDARAAEESVPAFREEDIVAGELIVIMRAGKKVRDLDLPEQARAPAKLRPGLDKLNAGVILVPAGEERAYIAKLKKNKNVWAVEPNYKVSAMLVPNDIFYASKQYGPGNIQAQAAWDVTTGASSTIIAIIDSGIDSAHPEFAGRIVPGYDFVQNDSTPQDGCGHGTHVAGIAAAAGNNGIGIAGIAWNARIMPVRVLDNACGGSYADVADGIIWAVDHGASIINLSLGGLPSTLMENATYYAYSHGVPVFAAVGNDGVSVYYPAAYDWVMSIGATDSANARWGNSNYGAALDLMAPGVNVYSTTPLLASNNVKFKTSPKYSFLTGTSMASPHAAGAAALLMSAGCETPDQIYQALIDSALDLGAIGRDNETGYGLIQINAALTACAAPPPPLPPFSVEYDVASSLTCNSLAAYNWRDTSGGAWLVSPGNDGFTSAALPFTFNYAGVDYNSINIHANGFISLGNHNTGTSSAYEYNYENNSPLPGVALPNNMLAPFWDNLAHAGGTGGLYTRANGSEFIIEYRNFQRDGISNNLNFQVVLFQGSNEILFQYKTLSGAGADGASATVGLDYENGQSGIQYSYNESALEEGLALRFIPYASADNISLPTDVCPQTQAVTIGANIPRDCNAAAADFDLDIDPNVLQSRAILKIRQIASAPPMPAKFLDLQEYADLQFRYAPPAIAPLPQALVCYQYTADDVLVAGGHPENLFIAAHDATTEKWEALPTLLDAPNSYLFAFAPHFSYYGVATLNPQSAAPGSGLKLPVTGAPLWK
jgi:thermitase